MNEPEELADDLSRLVAAVKKYWGQDGSTPKRPDAEVLPFKSLTLWVDLIGQHCLGYDGPPALDPKIDPDKEHHAASRPDGLPRRQPG